MINVTKPFLPPIEDYQVYLKTIWENNWLTNNGPLVQELEEKLRNFLDVPNVLYSNNGTIALQIAIKALQLTGEIITTPFSYVATTNSILWEGCIPVFADIKESDANIDPEKIEALITDKTSAILATHVYGNPCDVDAISAIASKHGLKVIYDGAHAFATTYRGEQLLKFGDISTCSFHATKLFHTAEGGAMITNDDELADKISLLRSFGHRGDSYFTIGVNGKSSEFHAAIGLCLLPSIDLFIGKRKKLSELYEELLKDLPVRRPVAMEGTQYNYSYLPVFTESEEKLLQIQTFLQTHQVFSRRYFYPSLNNLPQYQGEACPVSESMSVRALCLPLYYELAESDVEYICGLIKTCF